MYYSWVKGYEFSLEGAVELLALISVVHIRQKKLLIFSLLTAVME